MRQLTLLLLPFKVVTQGAIQDVAAGTGLSSTLRIARRYTEH